MAQRPSLLDLRSKSSSSNASAASKPLRSPRLHTPGEVPPELSPLDAFALQSRLLARQLQGEGDTGRRMSRLPPLTLDSPLVQQGRSEYFRSMSQDATSDASISPEPQHTNFGFRTEVDENTERPRSMHPRMSRIPPTPDDSIPLPTQPLPDALRGRPLSQIHETQSSFGARREASPDAMEHALDDAQTSPRQLPLQPSYPPPTSSPERITKKPSLDGSALAPPRPSFAKRPSASSTASSPLEPPEDHPLSGSTYSLPPRKLSSASSAFGGSMPAVSPRHVPIGSHRSPSISSEISVKLPRPSFNFSRPLSRAGTPGPETPSRQASADSQPSFVLADDAAHTPISMTGEGFPEGYIDDGKSAAPSYIYSKFSLPRGKTIQRSEPEDKDPQASFREQPIAPPGNVQTIPRGAPPSPPTRPSSSAGKGLDADLAKLSTDPAAGGASMLQPSPNPSRPSTEGGRMSEDSPRGRSLVSPRHDEVSRGKAPVSAATSDSASTIKPSPSQRSLAPTSADMTAEQHLAKGIECHENGSVQESTYHLRHAAKLNHPTGMLLYALACRHGWGMRPNQQEGVQWLRKAAESVSLEIADDEDQLKEGKRVDVLDSKTRKAQFALSIYELGVSHMNGWGIEQDKGLALRCFEIAGCKIGTISPFRTTKLLIGEIAWGDTDALAEAGYCYAQGVGCKKNLKKAAKFYREAEAKGMSMVGNSWIHKPKYNDDDDGGSPKSTKSTKSSWSVKSSKKARSKSRTRALFSKRTPTS